MTALLVTAPIRDAPATKRADDRAVVAVVAFAVAMLPLLHPKGPGHIAPADVAMGVAVIFSLLWAAATRVRLHLPFAVPVALMVVAGSTAAIGGLAPTTSAQALVQDLFLLSWCGAIATVCRTPEALAVVVRTWAWSSIGWAAILVGGRLSGHPAIAGIHRGYEGGRAQLTFDHPNMAASYFVISLLVVLASRSPRHPAGRAAACLLLSSALFYTGSNAALLGLPIAAMVGLFFIVRHRTDVVTAMAATLLITLSGVAAGYLVAQVVVSRVQHSDSSLVQNSLARSSKSAGARGQLFTEQLRLIRSGPVRGSGPATTKLALETSSAYTIKEAHNDLLATMGERGPLGVIGLMLLVTAVAVRTSAALPGHVSPAFSAAVPGATALVGAVVLLGVASSVHEVLHYRHAWALFGIVAALHLHGRSPVAAPAGGMT